MRIISEPTAELETVLVVRPVGHLDTVGSERFWETVFPQLSGPKISLLVDLCKVDFMSSAGVCALIRLLGRVGQRGGVMAVCGCHARVMAVLHVLKLENVLNVCRTEEDAKKKLRELGAA